MMFGSQLTWLFLARSSGSYAASKKELAAVKLRCDELAAHSATQVNLNWRFLV